MVPEPPAETKLVFSQDENAEEQLELDSSATHISPHFPSFIFQKLFFLVVFINYAPSMPVLLTTGPSLPSEEIRGGRRRIVADGRIRSDVTVRGKKSLSLGRKTVGFFFPFSPPWLSPCWTTRPWSSSASSSTWRPSRSRLGTLRSLFESWQRPKILLLLAGCGPRTRWLASPLTGLAPLAPLKTIQISRKSILGNV